jgi:hypothetical protein
VFTRFQATALFSYNANGLLTAYNLTEGTFEQQQFDFFFKHFPKTIKQLQTLREWKLKNVRISEVQPDISFDAFYNAYAHKISKRKTAETVWEKMPDTEKIKAIAYIPTYDRYLRESKVNKKYPETYLNSEMWNN